MNTLGPLPPIDPELLRLVMRHWTTGVAILAAREGQALHGMTINSFASVSLDPPLVLASIEAVVRTHGMIQRTGAFAVSFLCEGQQWISDRFAGRDTENSDRFESLETFSALTGAPILAGNIGWLDCVVVAAHPAGSHTIFIAQVVAASPGQADVTADPADGGLRPLMYFNRAYRQMR